MKFRAAMLAGPSILVLAQIPAFAQSAPVPQSTVAPIQEQLDAEAAATAEAKGEGDNARLEEILDGNRPADARPADIVVTGTSLRGVAPTGSNVVAITAEDIQASGATSANQLLSQLPQLGGQYFNNVPQIQGGSDGGLDINRPNARGVPSGNQDTGNATLVLLNGQRTSAAGIRNQSADPEGVPVALLQRVELNTDGGSSVYGSDAIGGTLNFVTRRKFDGVQLSGRYGFADDYHQWDANVIVGKDWGPTSAYVSYSRSENTPLFARDRDYYRVINWATGLPVGLNCDAPNVRLSDGAGGFRYYGVSAEGTVSLVANPDTNTQINNNGILSPNLCTLGREQSLVSAVKRNNVLATFSHDFSDDLELTVRGRFSTNHTTSYREPFNVANVNARPNNPYYQNLVGTVDAGRTQTVLLSFAPLVGVEDRRTEINFRSWGVTPEVKWDISDDWQLRTFFSYDRTDTDRWSQEYNAALITQYTSTSASSTTNAINPYNLEGTINKDLLNNIRNWERVGKSFNEIINVRAIVDGALFELPAGNVRVALGAEYLWDHFGRAGSVEGVRGVLDLTDASGNLINPVRDASRNVKSVFGEVDIPFFSDKNEMPMMHELRLSLQGRFDSYSDWGSSFNPRIGLNYAPTEWITFRGNWGTTFRAPSIIDTLGSDSLVVSVTAIAQAPFVVSPDPSATPPPANSVVLVYNGGTNPDLQPQTGTNWSVGADIRPLSGLRASASYYYIKYKGEIGSAVGNNLYNGATGIPPYSPRIPGSVIVLPDGTTLASGNPDVAQFLAQSVNAETVSNQLGSLPIYGLIDLRTRNLGRESHIAGIDYSLNYTSRTGFGSVFFNFSGNIQLVQERQAEANGPFTDQLPGGSVSRLSVTAGGTYGKHLRAQLQWNHTGGYDVPTPGANRNGQDHIGSYDVFNLFASYAVDGTGLGSDLEFTLGINNLFDTDPPVLTQNGSVGYTNGGTIGRLFQFGVTKKF